MKKQLMLLFLVGLLAAAMASCTSTETWGTTNPAIVKVKVFNYLESAQAGTASEIYFTVTNVTDQELRDLTLTVTTSRSRFVEVPFTEMTIDRIAPNGTWTPREPFTIRSRYPGEISVFFTVTENGKYLAKDYALVEFSDHSDEMGSFDMR